MEGDRYCLAGVYRSYPGLILESYTRISVCPLFQFPKSLTAQHSYTHRPRHPKNDRAKQRRKSKVYITLTCFVLRRESRILVTYCYDVSAAAAAALYSPTAALDRTGCRYLLRSLRNCSREQVFRFPTVSKLSLSRRVPDFFFSSSHDQ